MQTRSLGALTTLVTVLVVAIPMLWNIVHALGSMSPETLDEVFG